MLDDEAQTGPVEELSEKEIIGRAVVQVVASHGYEAATLEMVLERASIGRAGFERHYASLDDCVRSEFEEMVQIFVDRVTAAYQSQDAWADGLRALGYEILDAIDEDRERARFFTVEVLSAGEGLQPQKAMILQGIIDLVDLGRQELPDPASMSRSTAEVVVGSAYETIVKKLQRGGPRQGEEILRELMYIVVLPYLGTEAAVRELEMPRPVLVR
jgi:AcrR family transcriptional regulator